MQAADFLPMSRAQLRDALLQGHPVDPAALDDSEYRGTALGMPLLEKVTWKTFQKSFHRDPDTGSLRGWNVRLQQDGVGAPPVAKQRRGRPWTFGHFEVLPAEGRPNPIAVDQALLLDYGRGDNPALDVTSALRDPIVAVHAGSTDLLLGWSYLEFGPLRIPTPSYFTLERIGPLSHVPD